MSGIYLPSGISPARLRIEAAGRAHQASQARAASERNKAAGMAKTERERRMATAAHRAEALHYSAPLTLRERVLAMVAEVCKARGGTSVEEVMGEGRRHQMVSVRHECFWRCRHELGISLAATGRLFNKDHTTILNGCRNHKARMGTPEVPFS
jgi:chromosomal replication initiation ATPase DnaA